MTEATCINNRPTLDNARQNTLTRNFSMLTRELQGCMPKIDTAQPPLARVFFCAYPGRSPISRGHSFIAIEPVSKHFDSGRIQLGSQTYIGRVAVGVSPKGNSTSDRIYDLPMEKPAQLRNDNRYLHKPMTRCVALDVHNQQDLERGLGAINQFAKNTGTGPTIQKIENMTVPETEITSRAHNDQPPMYSKSTNSQHYALQLFQAFCPLYQLPEPLQHMNGIDSKAAWHRLTDDFHNQPQPQTLSRVELHRLIQLRRDGPEVLASADHLVTSLTADLKAIEQKIAVVTDHIRNMQKTYQPAIIAVGAALLEESNTEFTIFSQAFQNFSKALEDAATLAHTLEKPDSLLGMGTAFVSAALDSNARVQFFNAVSSFHLLITSGQIAFERLNRVTEVVPNAQELMKQLGDDITTLLPPALELAQLTMQMPQRFIDYLDHLQASLQDAGRVFARG